MKSGIDLAYESVTGDAGGTKDLPSKNIYNPFQLLYQPWMILASFSYYRELLLLSP